MRRQWSAIGMSLIVSVMVATAQPGTKVRISGQRVNLRARADMNSEVVGQLNANEVVSAKSFQGEWVEIVPPETVDVWVHRDFVDDNRVTASKLQVRGGPGINYSVVGDLSRNDTITIRGEFGEWRKIAPTPAMSLWISRELVELLQPEKPRAPAVQAARPSPEPAVVEPAAPPAPAPIRSEPPPTAAAAQTAPTPTPQIPSDLKLIPLEGQGKSVQREGVLRVAGFVFGRPSRYRLVRQEGSRIETICYVRGNNAQLDTFLGQKLLIRGREYWVRGVRDAVVIPEQIVPRAR